MSSKRFFITAVSAVLMLGVSAWAGDHDGDEPHGHGHEYHEHHGDVHGHPGAAHGQKRGWRGCDLPPGQAKKYGCVAPVHTIVVAPPPPAHVVVVAPPPPPHVVVVVPQPPSVHVRVALPPPPAVSLHVDAVIHP
jgi:hypothetical protein